MFRIFIDAKNIVPRALFFAWALRADRPSYTLVQKSARVGYVVYYASFRYNLRMADAKKILLVEDEPLLGNLLRQRLEREGFAVFHAKDGNQGLEYLKTNAPDLVLLDIILPKVSGFEFMEKVQSSSEYQKAPIVIISNLGQDTDLERGQALGAIGYFVKARVSMEDLVEKVRDFLTSEGG